MRKTLLLLLMMLGTAAYAQVPFDSWFTDNTLRLDYVFTGNAREQQICLADLSAKAGWAGRRNHLDETLLQGSGQLRVHDHATGRLIYVWTFATLFREWLHEPEAKVCNRSFETSYYIPMPKAPVDITVVLRDSRNRITASLTHSVDPASPLIRQERDPGHPYRYIHLGKDTLNTRDCIDLAILAEGYTAEEMPKFYADAQRAADALFKWEPFRSMRDRFNIVAIAAPCQESGTSIPHKGIWRNTLLSAHFGTFGTDRYLTTQQLFRIYDCMAGVAAEHVIVLVNSDEYGGGGIYNQLTLVTADHWTFQPVLVHEFGHAYGGLTDEYDYAGDGEPWYPLDIEPWEPNITTLVDFQSKWADMLPAGTPVPTPLDPSVPDFRTIAYNDTAALRRLNEATQVLGVFEGAGYLTEGCYRPAQECRMKINSVEDFCPVCTRALRQITDYYTK